MLVAAALQNVEGFKAVLAHICNTAVDMFEHGRYVPRVIGMPIDGAVRTLLPATREVTFVVAVCTAGTFCRMRSIACCALRLCASP